MLLETPLSGSRLPIPATRMSSVTHEFTRALSSKSHLAMPPTGTLNSTRRTRRARTAGYAMEARGCAPASRVTRARTVPHRLFSFKPSRRQEAGRLIEIERKKETGWAGRVENLLVQREGLGSWVGVEREEFT